MNKKINNIIFALSICLLSSFVYAEPSPFGITIKTTTAEELKEKYSVKEMGVNTYSNGKVYDISPEQVEFEGLESLRVIFSEDNKALGIFSVINKDKYNQLFNMLSLKYKLVSKKDAFVGDQSAVFIDGKTKITLVSPHLSFTLNVNYVHKDLNDAFDKISSEEKKQKSEKEAAKL